MTSVAQRLRQKLLDLAIHGKRVPQDPKDEPAGELLERIRNEELGIRNCRGKGKTGLTGFTGLRGGKRNPVNHINPVRKYIPVTDDEKPFDLPKGWEWRRLGEVGEWGAGATPSRKNPEYYKDGKIPWLKTGDLNDGVVTCIPESITEKALAETSVRLNPIGSVMMAMYGATIGRVGILGIEATTNQACCVCRVNELVDYRYLFYYLMSQREQFKRLGGGGAQPNISKELIVTYPVPLPPLAEQKRIVAKVKEMLAACDALGGEG